MHRDRRLGERGDRRACSAPPRSARIESALVERAGADASLAARRAPGPLDEAIRALRAQRRPPVEPDRPDSRQVLRHGLRRLRRRRRAWRALKAPDGWRFVAAMTKPRGVEEVLSLEGPDKRQVDAHRARHARERDGGADRRRRRRELPRNWRSARTSPRKTPPPFKLIAFVENLGLGPLAPRADFAGRPVRRNCWRIGRRTRTTPRRWRGRTSRRSAAR